MGMSGGNPGVASGNIRPVWPRGGFTAQRGEVSVPAPPERPQPGPFASSQTNIGAAIAS